MAKHAPKRAKRKERIRRKIIGTAERPRLTVYKSLKHIYAQVVDDTVGKTLASASTGSKGAEGRGQGRRQEAAAKKVGEAIARGAKEKEIEAVVFDRNGFPYHGRVAAVADGGARGRAQALDVPGIRGD